MKHASNMTSKGQVTVPKDIRDRLGLTAGSVVSFAVDDDGAVRLTKATGEGARLKKRAAIKAGMARAQALFAANNRFPGMATDAFMDMIREPVQLFERGEQA